jgi:tetratricopeptide (TPR) repeat protein
MRARRLLAVVLAFACALAVSTVTRRDERAAAGPPPDRATALAEAAGRAASRHDFRGALRIARQSRALAPEALAAYPVLVDALVELGRYGEAERTLQRFVDLRPGLASYTRVSYFRQLHGDLGGAAAALRLAVAAGGPPSPEVAYVQSLLGSLEINRGRLRAARRAFAAASAGVPGYGPAADGRADLAAAGGRLGEAIRRLRRLVTREPGPDYATALAELRLVAGDRRAARRGLALAREQEQRLATRGYKPDAALVIFESDHGDRSRGLKLARTVWSRAPSVTSADALGWALTRAGRPRAGLRWARRALRLGSLDPHFRYHAGVAAIAAGRRAEGRRNLRLAIAHGLAAHPLHLRRVERALR